MSNLIIILPEYAGLCLYNLTSCTYGFKIFSNLNEHLCVKLSYWISLEAKVWVSIVQIRPLHPIFAHFFTQHHLNLRHFFQKCFRKQVFLTSRFFSQLLQLQSVQTKSESYFCLEHKKLTCFPFDLILARIWAPFHIALFDPIGFFLQPSCRPTNLLVLWVT